MASQKIDKEKEKMMFVGVGALLGLLVLVKLAKFLPALFVGLIMSLFLTSGLRSKEPWDKCINTVSNVFILSLGTLFFFGMPVEISKPQYHGFLPYWPLRGMIEWFGGLHDSVIGKYETTLFQKALIKEASFIEVSQVLWLSLPIAFFFGVLFYALPRLLGKEGGIDFGIGGLSTRFLNSVLRVIHYPIRWSMTVPWNLLSSFLGLFLVLGAQVIIFNFIMSKGEGVLPAEYLSPLQGILLLTGLVNFIYIYLMFFMVMRSFFHALPGFNLLAKLTDFCLQPVYGVLHKEIPKKLKEAKRSQEQVALGKDIHTRKQVSLTRKNLNYHTQIVGGSGAGKTNLLKSVISQRIEDGAGLIFLDLKADFETVDWLSRVTTKYKRSQDVKIFSLTHPDISMSYNPMARGSATELHSKLMNSIKWSEEFYRKTASHALSDALVVLCNRRNKGLEFYLEDVYRAVSSPEALETYLDESFWKAIDHKAIASRIERLKTKEGQQEVKGLATDLLNLTRSSAGELLKQKTEESIDLFEAIKEKEIVYFLLDSMSEKESSEMLGRLLLQDLITTTGHVYNQIPEVSRCQVQVIIDEFASFATPNFIDFINRARGAGLGVMVAHQSRGDLREVSDNFCDRLERNCGTKLVFGTDNDEDAEYFASMVGTRSTFKDTYQMEEGWFFKEETGNLSRREVEEFIVHPNMIKSLQQGQILRVSRLVDPGVNLINLYRVGEFSDTVAEIKRPALREEGITEQLETRESLDFFVPEARSQEALGNKPGPLDGGDFV